MKEKGGEKDKTLYIALHGILQSKNTKLNIYNITTIRHIRTCYLTLMHKEKQKVCNFL